MALNKKNLANTTGLGTLSMDIKSFHGLEIGNTSIFNRMELDYIYKIADHKSIKSTQQYVMTKKKIERNRFKNLLDF
ncbi:hypothetical protein D3C87_130580 [compost metagenome]